MLKRDGILKFRAHDRAPLQGISGEIIHFGVRPYGEEERGNKGGGVALL